MMDQDPRGSDNMAGVDTSLDADDPPAPSQGGSMGGGLQREIGKRDEEKAAFENAGEGQDPSVTRVHASDKPNDGDAPNLPNRLGGSGVEGTGDA